MALPGQRCDQSGWALRRVPAVGWTAGEHALGDRRAGVAGLGEEDLAEQRNAIDGLVAKTHGPRRRR